MAIDKLITKAKKEFKISDKEAVTIMVVSSNPFTGRSESFLLGEFSSFSENIFAVQNGIRAIENELSKNQ